MEAFGLTRSTQPAKNYPVGWCQPAFSANTEWLCALLSVPIIQSHKSQFRQSLQERFPNLDFVCRIYPPLTEASKNKNPPPGQVGARGGHTRIVANRNSLRPKTPFKRNQRIAAHIFLIMPHHSITKCTVQIPAPQMLLPPYADQ